MNPFDKARDEYLLQRIQSASPEQLVALLLEGAQRFVAQAVQACGRKDVPARAQAINRALFIVEELLQRLNHDAGTEVVENLTRIYDWWTWELVDASSGNHVARLERVSRQMGDLRESWEALHLRHQQHGSVPAYVAEGLVG